MPKKQFQEECDIIRNRWAPGLVEPALKTTDGVVSAEGITLQRQNHGHIFGEALWQFALEHAVCLWNHLPKSRSGLSPHELFTGSVTPNREERTSRARVWGSPAWALDPALQDRRCLPRWSKRSALGMHLGVSPTHSTTVGHILNLCAGKIAPQCHVAHDKLLATAQGRLQCDALDPATWNELLQLGGREQGNATVQPQISNCAAGASCRLLNQIGRAHV